CKKFVDIDSPKTQLVSESVFKSDATATAAMLGIYSSLMNSNYSFINSQITIQGGLSSDELVDYSHELPYAETYENSLSPDNSNVMVLWRDTFNYIYQSNAVIEGLTNNNNLTADTKSQLMGEAKFIRALCHFYLVNFFGDIPYIQSTDYKVNNTVSRLPASDVYKLIIADLKDSQTLLNEDYVDAQNNAYNSDPERIRPNKAAATALLARVYLYTQDWANAEAQSNSVISNAAVYSLVPDLNEVFLKNSKEAIWQLMPVTPGINTPEGFQLILTAAPGYFAISNDLLNSFEPDDNRKNDWIGQITDGTDTYYYPFKYKVINSDNLTEYYMVLRLAEQYLIRAEARCQLNDIAGAVGDVNVIRERAGLPDLPATLSQADCLAAIEKERRSEMFVEMGDRWLNLKRLNHADLVLQPLKSPNWQPTDVLYPVPQVQLIADVNMIQNPGY
ncbi:MAG: RagB/SusD family nutrient uptake outer membrane protein, partial [Flavobacterium sp.]